MFELHTCMYGCMHKHTVYHYAECAFFICSSLSHFCIFLCVLRLYIIVSLGPDVEGMEVSMVCILKNQKINGVEVESIQRQRCIVF